MAGNDVKLAIGAIIAGVVITAFVNDASLNLSGLIKTFGTILAWLPTAVALMRMSSKVG